MAKILISGGNGVLGRALTKELLKEGIQVNWLSRKAIVAKDVPVFLWDPEKKQIDLEAFRNVDHLVNLSGSSIAGKPWNKKNKQEIYDSRIKSTRFLLETLQKNNIVVRSICGASAIGYYGTDCGENWCDESNPVGKDFLAGVCKDWEKIYTPVSQSTRVVTLRIGIVLSREGGMYASLRPWVNAGLASVIGKGENYISWIHIHDLVKLIIHAITHPTLNGIYNAVASEPVTQTEFVRTMAASLKKKVWLPNVPEFILDCLLGERARLIYKGCRVKNDKIKLTSFELDFPKLAPALNDLAASKYPS